MNKKIYAMSKYLTETDLLKDKCDDMLLAMVNIRHHLNQIQANMTVIDKSLYLNEIDERCEDIQLEITNINEELSQFIEIAEK